MVLIVEPKTDGTWKQNNIMSNVTKVIDECLPRVSVTSDVQH